MYTREDCIESLKEAENILGNEPGIEEYRSLDLSPSAKTMEKKFGSWNKAKESAGMETFDPSDNLTGGTEYWVKYPPRVFWKDGYEKVKVQIEEESYSFLIHRLLAVSIYGYDEVKDMDVHHKNGVRWDNRPENIELLTPEEHMRFHLSERERNEDGSLV